MKTRTKTYIFVSLVAGIFLLFINACTMKEPIPNNNRDAINDALKDSIGKNKKLRYSNNRSKRASLLTLQKALMPEINMPNIHTGSLGDEKEQRFDISVNNVLAKDFFLGLVKDTKYNMTINPKIKDIISLELKGVTIPQAMDAARDTYGFEYKKTSYGYKVFPRQLETKIFNINYLDLDRSGQSQTTIGSGQITSTVQNTLTSAGLSSSQQSGSMPSGVINTTSQSKFWDLLKQNLETLIGSEDGRAVVINSKAGSVIVRAYPNEIRYVASYIDKVQNVLHRQVIIEAKILEVELSADFQNGINWRALGLKQGIAGAEETIGTALGDLAGQNTFPGSILGVLELKAQSGSAFSAFIRLLNSQGSVNVLSSPRVSTLNNQKAVIKVGNDKFFVTDVSSNTNTGSGGGTDTTADITLTPFFSGISLDVTPQIDENGYITIHIHPIVSQVTEDKKKFEVNGQNQNLPLASSTVRESDSVVRAKNGQVIVIGGLMASEGRMQRATTPGLDRLPGIGGIFKNNKKSARKFELVILLRPILAENTETWQKELNEAYSNIKKMKREFHYNIEPKNKRHRKPQARPNIRKMGHDYSMYK